MTWTIKYVFPYMLNVFSLSLFDEKCADLKNHFASRPSWRIRFLAWRIVSQSVKNCFRCIINQTLKNPFSVNSETSLKFLSWRHKWYNDMPKWWQKSINQNFRDFLLKYPRFSHKCVYLCLYNYSDWWLRNNKRFSMWDVRSKTTLNCWS